ncbi:unnamed protein product, partial [Protopolystoma xenopodis]
MKFFIRCTFSILINSYHEKGSHIAIAAPPGSLQAILVDMPDLDQMTDQHQVTCSLSSVSEPEIASYSSRDGGEVVTVANRPIQLNGVSRTSNSSENNLPITYFSSNQIQT